MSAVLLLSAAFLAQGESPGPAASRGGRMPEWARPGRCGTNCLYVILKILYEAGQLAHPVRYQDVVKRLPPDNDRGFSIAAIAEASRQLGVPMDTRKVSADDLVRVRKPLIAHLDLLDKGGTGHFITVYDVQRTDKGTFLHYVDGTTGQMSNDRLDNFQEIFSGFVLIPAQARRGDARWWPVLAGVAGLFVGLAAEWVFAHDQRMADARS